MVGYVLEYSICSLFFLSVVVVHFFCHRQFPNRQNAVFGVALVLAELDILFDILSSVVIDNVFSIEPMHVDIICGLFYLMQNVFGLLMATYVMILTGRFSPQRRGRLVLLLAPSLAAELLLLSNSFTHVIFYTDPARGYMHGSLFATQYVCVMLYIVYCFLLINIYRRRLARNHYWAVMGFLLILVAAVIVQYLYPPLLLTSPAIALAIVMMYLVMQKPEGMLDVTSGAFNYAALLVFLRDCIAERREYSLLVLQLDNLRNINWTSGISRGNQVLSKVHEYLCAAAGRGNWVFRMSGMRFAVTVRSMSEHERLLGEIRDRFSRPWEIDGARLLVNATIFNLLDTGIFSSVDEIVGLLASATDKHGQGEVVELDRDAAGVVYRRYNIEEILSGALERGELEVFFQPLYNDRKGVFPTAEALVRLPHDGKYISPSEFIPIAENSDAILRVDDFVLRRVCQYLKQMERGEGFGLLSVEVNLSAVEFLYDDVARRLSATVAEYGVSPRQIIFEITETAATAAYDAVHAIMSELREQGFRFALDDFGTGYANIAQVARLPFYAAKLDRGMLVSSTQSIQNEVVYRHTLKMFQELGLVTVAEGVETGEQAHMLHELGVDYIQGFHFARPMPFGELADFLRSRLRSSGE